ncbi:hypothetical protein [Pseudomonas palmensis]|uniref:hypothetical protein n=1 Tax=Pseudomonas palmensis TaxID=2815362 RepID=UPI0039E96A33
MLMFRKYSPQFTTPGEIEAKRYAEKLVWPATIVLAMLSFPMAQWLAAIVVVGLFLRVYVVGKNYRIHEPEFAAQFSLWKRLWVLKPAAKFLVVAAIVMGIAMGQTQWQGRTHAIYEVLQSLMTLKAMTSALLS